MNVTWYVTLRQEGLPVWVHTHTYTNTCTLAHKHAHAHTHPHAFIFYIGSDGRRFAIYFCAQVWVVWQLREGCSVWCSGFVAFGSLSLTTLDINKSRQTILLLCEVTMNQFERLRMPWSVTLLRNRMQKSRWIWNIFYLVFLPFFVKRRNPDWVT